MNSDKLKKGGKNNKKINTKRSDSTYLHMDHTANTNSQSILLLFSSLLVKKQQQRSLSHLQTLICPGSDTTSERGAERHRETLVSLELTATLPLSLSLLGGHETHTHRHTQCSLRHKGPHGNGAFRSPVALFMQRCITMGPPTGRPCQKSPPLTRSLSASLTRPLSLSFSLYD